MTSIIRIHTFLDNLPPRSVEIRMEIDQIIKEINQQVTLTDAQTISGIKTFSGTYLIPLIINTARIWHDTSAGTMRVKYGSDPANIADGTAFG